MYLKSGELLNKTMNQAEYKSKIMIKMPEDSGVKTMQQSVQPHLGSFINVKV
ncbi:putative motility protein [Salinibacillus xinjiangensis]|uniref:Putative motility protein n=1 Tax=Salinibacillus xinjiangensis TaxID=1229268 RepID=A0A6G1X1L1_9BACI|nr:putative motility protein [Salinibacillus xinjiangensis]MRG84776.1 putative motility protein [Salinibacillus xinjiangensis]